ncbi:nitrate/sulfonate/bicarbonate ABC transporter periplasmic protein [Arthrobacter crystallopoietes BAB-32]|uniref:Nitrate/sulfonate/bicarbonate ABC transporter periplasmic protein n=1 Tax=Arthrobacter crystallopoietes BAB-32 TaxID=1246476 RepID=N1UTT0_9MICC|nr:ABC transporter substrate-binding protein [Arthrobacter crystallopoietes]EMY33801.1 nitrate/sulfonate/bicarbonate ABC transporter periplasmic protein [Arthrobacter crystallopoietes BAB-32]
MKRLSTLLIAASASLALAACGSGSPSGSTVESEAAGGAEGLTEVRVGAIPIGDVAPIHLGKAQGFFEDEGLDLVIENTTGGAVAVPGVVSGDFDFAFGNTVSLMVARDQGLDLKYVANGTTTVGGSDGDFAGVVVAEDSDIQDATDLQGKTVSSNNLANIGDTSVRSAVDKAGGDGSTLEFVEVAFPDALAAVENGQVDAALILEPFLTPAVQSGARVVSWPYAETHPDLDIGGYFTTTEKIEQEPELVGKFTAAMKKSMEYAQENPDEVREIIGTYTKTDKALLEEITLPRFVPEFHRDAAQALGEAALKYGTISKAPDLDALLPAEGQ